MREKDTRPYNFSIDNALLKWDSQLGCAVIAGFENIPLEATQIMSTRTLHRLAGIYYPGDEKAQSSSHNVATPPHK